MSGAADVAVVLVHYRTPEVVPAAVSALQRSAEKAGLSAELLLVDNDGGDRAAFEALGLEVLGPGTNRGFAAGVNRGAAASRAPRIVLMNPDVVVARDCLGALCAALDDGAAAAGPRFFWDDEGRLLLPPLEPQSRRWQVASAAARLGPRWAHRARARWRRHARRHWLAAAPITSHALSGALLAVRRDAWCRVGPFDDGYRLYFEETDWLRRLRRAGLEARYVPAARARHRYGTSAAREPRSAAFFAASARRYRRKSYGPLFARGLETLEAFAARRGDAAPAQEPETMRAPPSWTLPAAASWVELSPLAVGFPAAGERLSRAADGRERERYELPRAVWDDLASGTYALAAVSDDGDELERHVFAVGGRGKS